MSDPIARGLVIFTRTAPNRSGLGMTVEQKNSLIAHCADGGKLSVILETGRAHQFCTMNHSTNRDIHMTGLDGSRFRVDWDDFAAIVVL